MKEDRRVDKVSFYGLMDLVMKENLRRIMCMDMDSISGAMEECIEVGGGIVKWILLIRLIVSSLGLMAESISYFYILIFY